MPQKKKRKEKVTLFQIIKNRLDTNYHLFSMGEVTQTFLKLDSHKGAGDKKADQTSSSF